MTSFATDYVAGHRFVGGMAEAFEARGGKVVQKQWIPLGTKDIAPYITALKDADFVAPWLAGITATVGLRQIREFKVNKPVIMPQTGFMAHPVQIKQIGDNGVGIITTDAYVWTIDTPENKDFVARYKKRWGEVPAGAAYGGYFSVQLALAALKKTGGNTAPDAIAKALDDTNITGLLGKFTFGDGRIGVGNYIVHKAYKTKDPKYPYLTKVLAKYKVHPILKGGKMTFRAERVMSK
jgi:branched-chain amino acid transport system substrate-binding protein